MQKRWKEILQQVPGGFNGGPIQWRNTHADLSRSLLYSSYSMFLKYLFYSEESWSLPLHFSLLQVPSQLWHFLFSYSFSYSFVSYSFVRYSFVLYSVVSNSLVIMLFVVVLLVIVLLALVFFAIVMFVIDL